MSWDNEVLKRKGLITTGFHLPYNPGLIETAKLMRRNATEAEKKLWVGSLRDLKFRVLRQRPIDNFIVDFYCPKLKLIIEIDGASHFSEEGKGADRERTAVLNSYGLKVIRFTNRDVMNNFSRVVGKINQLILSPLTPLDKGGTRIGQ